ncbi:MAG TPA: type I 3-dehydroquinate dehydratase [Kiritimatiellia bacterium]|nr:type I 3-dehydroquinate dehydratase [Kiritimatiellia bacterium]
MFLGYDMDPGFIPLVVGIVSTPEGLEKVSDDFNFPCDVVEIRLDLIGEDSCNWPVAAHRITKAGIGTLLTIRHVSEGGRWSADEQSRLDCYIQGLPHVTGIDIELNASILPDITAVARSKATIVGSHHQFRKMPTSAELQAVVKSGQAAGVDVTKIAAYANDRTELNRLSQLLKKNSKTAVCALAMGPMGPESRIELPMVGSCLTYGYLDKPNAPGQPSAADIRNRLMAKHEEYRVFVEIRNDLGS